MEMETTGRDRNDNVGVRSVGIQVETEEISTRQELTMEAADNVLKSVSPLINSMKLFGLHFARQPREDPSDSSQPSWRSLGRCQGWTPTRIYATIILLVIWINAVRYYLVFDGIDTLGVEMLIKLGLMANVLLIVVLQTAYYVASHTGSLDRVFRQANLPTAEFCPKYSRRAKVLTIVCWLLVAFCTSCYIFPMFTNRQHADETLLIFINTFHLSTPYSEILSAISAVLELQLAASLVFPQAMNYIVVSLLCDQFNKLNEEFSKCIGGQGEFNGNFEQFRRRHQAISHSVQEADRFLMISNVACFCCHMLGIIVVFFSSVFYLHQTVLYGAEWAFLYTTWLVINLLGLMLAAGLAIIINNKVTT